MKAAIITFHRAINYGAVLQTYALQQVITELGIDNNVIDYRSRSIESLYDVWHPFKHNVKTLAFVSKAIKKMHFNHFVKKYIQMTESVTEREMLGRLRTRFDYFITGSDQVWCEKCATEETAFFLDFVEESTKKFSYAASIGKNVLSESMQDVYKKLLSCYNEISIREESARNILKLCEMDENVSVHVDPTLLLEQSKWDKIRKKHVEKKKYILVYTVLGQYKLFDFARQLSKKTGLPIIYLNDTFIHREKGMQYKVAVSPQQFVGYFAEAEYVITNSFHGTVFSILYHKTFWVEIEAVGRRNIRSEELLEKLGLSCREIDESMQFNLDDKVDWNLVDGLLDVEREKSKQYLLKIDNCEKEKV